MKETQLQIKLPGVPMAKQGREVPPRWDWTEASVWTERMLATLERGIKGGKWFSLMDKVWKMENLQRAAAKGGCGQKLKESRRTPSCRQYAEQSSPHDCHALQRKLQSRPATGPSPRNGSGYPNWAAKNCDRWEYRRWKTGWWKWPCAT